MSQTFTKVQDWTNWYDGLYQEALKKERARRALDEAEKAAGAGRASFGAVDLKPEPLRTFTGAELYAHRLTNAGSSPSNWASTKRGGSR